MTSPRVVGLVGSGPAVDAVESAITEVGARSESVDGAAVGSADVDLVVAVAPAGAGAFDRVQRRVEGSWIAVELGGVGGRPTSELDVTVSVLDSSGPCFECLRARVRANAEDDDRGGDGTAPRTTRSDARLGGAVAGRLAVSILDGDDVCGRVIEHPYAERQILPVPGCTCGGTTPWSSGLETAFASVTIDETARLAEGAVDERVGLVREVGEAHSFPAPYYLATLCDTTSFADARAGPHAAGVAIDWTTAFVKAVGEALERYGAGVYRQGTFETAPAEGLPTAVPPSMFVRSSAEDDPDPAASIAWVDGASLHDGRAVKLPAEFVLFPPPERRHVPPITTGLGLGSSGVGALLSGLYEVVERDATMLSWYSTVEPLGLTVDDSRFSELARRARSEDLAVTPLLVTLDVDVPVVAVAVHREGEWPRFAVGSDADLDPNAAARSALEEALQNWMELRAMGPERAAADSSDVARYAEFPRAARSFVDVETSVPADTLGPDEPPSGTDELDAVVGRLDEAGLEAFAARLTPRDVARLGFEVVRVTVPSAQPLFTGEAFFGDRARSVPKALGYRPRLDGPPHPYP